ncbi:MAG: thiamine pyrophosphate-binding protein, partial [Simkaniaceae bacterium]|nr:thiamine pyrophosphate-binding protein [Simkaniaceae bacterium]
GHPDAKTHVHYDERGLGFYALGIAKASGKPACVIITSGTAVGNLLPAVMEAFHAKIPLVILSADRPDSLHGTGANQTCNQKNIFGTYAKTIFTYDGPTHINCPFSEPFLQTPPEFFSEKIPRKKTPMQIHPLPPIEFKRCIVIVGNGGDNETAQKLGWPVFSDILSYGKRLPTPKIPTDKCDTVIHFGGSFVSKKLQNYLEFSQPKTYLHISHDGEIFDPFHLVTKRIFGNISTEKKPLATFDEETTFDPLFSTLEGFDTLFIGNSLPIRQADKSFFPEKPIKIFANRGLSGIDGNIATASGIADVSPGKTAAIIGDQTFLHDLNSLPLAKNLTLIVINNGGGQIFSHLPIAKHEKLCEKYFINPHSMTFEHIAKQFNIPYSTTMNEKPGIIELCQVPVH